MINKIMIEENIFPRWEHNIPTLGTKHSHAGNKTRLRLVVTLLLMMVVGVNGVKAQTVDYSGTYFIAYYGFGSGYYNDSNPVDNYYWCPVECKTGTWEGWFDFYPDDDTDNDTKTDTYSKTDTKMDFLTTHKCRDGVYESRNAQWIITKHETLDAYYIQHKKSSKYLTMNGSMKNAGSTNRLRVHLQEDIAPNNKSLFEIVKHEVKTYGTSYVIKPYSQNQYINVSGLSTNSNTGNYDELYGTNGKTDGPTDLPNVGGTLGWYSDINDKNGQWFLEDYIKRPTIGYDASGNIVITNNDASTTVYYTKGGGDPKTSGTALSETTETLTSFTDGTVIKAVAKVGDEYSNVVTFTAVVHVGSSNQYLIKNLECTDFYMIPGDVSNNNTYVNTTSLFRPTMSWYFSDAGSVGGVQYYYIINGHTENYLYFTNNNVYMKTSSDFDESDSYKFAIVQGFDADSNPDGFHIVPKSQISDNTYCIYKGGWADTTPPTIANSKSDAVKGSTNARRPEQKHTRWNFVQPNTLNKTAPFKITDASTHITKFYKIASVGSSGYYIVPPTGNNTNVTTSNSADAAVVKSGTWYFEKAQDATDADWCTYYYIRNAETGKYLYFTKDGTDYATNPKACLEMRETKSGDEDPYLFTWARTAEENVNYYIVPKKLKDVSLNTISTLQRNGTTLQSNTRRDAGNYAWTFEDAALFCSNPIFEESGDNIVISCIPGLAEIHYTTNGDDPKADGYLVYPPTTPFSKSEQHLIRACAVVSDGTTPTSNTAFSAVITLLNKPDVTLEAGPYIYKGAPWEPEVTSVSIGNESTSSGYTVSYSSEHTNAGNVNITISDVDATDDWYIWNATKTFTITPAALTVTADAKMKEYGDADPELTYTSTGLIGEDAITGVMSRAEGEDTGIYAISQGTLTAGNNYAITYTSANLTINKKSLGDGTTPAAGIVINIDGNDVVTVTRTSPTSVDLTLDTDFTVSGPTEEEGNQIWTITGINNYDGGAKVMRIGLTFNETEIATGSNVHDVTPYKASVDMTIDGLDAYIVTHINMTKRKVTIKKINYVKKNEPLLLLTDLPGAVSNFTATPKHVEEGDVVDTSDNLLKVSPAGGQTVGFGEVYMYYQGKFVMTTGGTLAEGKFYLDNPNPPSSSGGGGTSNAPLRIVIDDTTEIGTIDNGQLIMDNGQSGEWYTLDGRRLSGKPAKKGLYIWNGQKRVVK